MTFKYHRFLGNVCIRLLELPSIWMNLAPSQSARVPTTIAGYMEPLLSERIYIGQVDATTLYSALALDRDIVVYHFDN